MSDQVRPDERGEGREGESSVSKLEAAEIRRARIVWRAAYLALERAMWRVEGR